MKAYITRILGAAIAMTIAMPAWAQGTSAMPASQQNALVQKYCAVCHSDAKMMGGLSLEQFDAAHPDPSIAAMMVNKLNSGAMGAAGIAQPDRSVVDALASALSAEAAGGVAATNGWTFKAFNDPVSKAPLVTASIVRELPSTNSRDAAPAYQLTVTCQKNSDVAKGGNAADPADIQITTYTKGSNGLVPRPLSGSLPFTYEVDGTPQASVWSGGVIPLRGLPSQELTIRNLFPGEAVLFPFGGLNDTLRRVLSTCIGKK